MTSLAKKAVNENLIKNPDILYKYSVDMLVITCALLLAGSYLNGANAIRLALWSVVTAVICEDIGCRIMKRTDKKACKLYAAVTGLAIALMLPASAPAYIAAVASLFAVVAVLIPFGSARKVPFVPAAAGICFVTVCFPEAVFAYPAVNIGEASPLFGSEGFVGGESFAKMLTYGKSVILNPLEHISVLVGKNPGPTGTTCMLVLMGAAVYVLLKRKEDFIVSISFFASCALFAALFPRVNSGVYTSVVMELSSGMLVFAGLVLLPNPFTSPATNGGKAAYGVFAGILCMLLRRYGIYEEPVCFAVLIMNAASPAAGDYFAIFTDSLKEKGIIKKKTPKFSQPAPETEKPEKMKKTKKEKPEKPKKEKAVKTKAEKEKTLGKKSDKKASRDKEDGKKYRIDSLSYEELMSFEDNTSSAENNDAQGGENNG